MNWNTIRVAAISVLLTILFMGVLAIQQREKDTQQLLKATAQLTKTDEALAECTTAKNKLERTKASYAQLIHELAKTPIDPDAPSTVPQRTTKKVAP